MVMNLIFKTFKTHLKMTCPMRLLQHRV